MQRIHFTAADLARTRLKTTAGPETETRLAAELLARRGSAVYSRWRRRTAKLLKPSTSSGQVRPELVWRAAVAPYWQGVVAYLESECDALGRIVMTGGVEQLLATLHPRITWSGQLLEIPGGSGGPDGPDDEIVLGGRGLVLCPSVFLDHRPAVLTGTGRPGAGGTGVQPGGVRTAGGPAAGQATLVFAATPDATRAAALWGEPCEQAQALGALVGQTRAAALRALRSSCTTGQLADRLGISAPCASQHTAVLRKAGLITTRRTRNVVVHSVTQLGLALLDGTPGADSELRAALLSAPSHRGAGAERPPKRAVRTPA